MRVLPPVEEAIRRIVRDEPAKDPLASVSKLEAALEKHFQRGFSHQYVSKIADKVAREGLIEADRTKLEERTNFTRENYRLMRERLMKIVGWKIWRQAARQPRRQRSRQKYRHDGFGDLTSRSRRGDLARRNFPAPSDPFARL